MFGPYLTVSLALTLLRSVYISACSLVTLTLLRSVLVHLPRDVVRLPLLVRGGKGVRRGRGEGREGGEVTLILVWVQDTHLVRGG